jgi:hypothetical protein
MTAELLDNDKNFQNQPKAIAKSMGGHWDTAKEWAKFSILWCSLGKFQISVPEPSLQMCFLLVHLFPCSANYKWLQ